VFKQFHKEGPKRRARHCQIEANLTWRNTVPKNEGSQEKAKPTVFQITYKSRGSIDVDLFKSSQVDHLFCRIMLPALSGF